VDEAEDEFNALRHIVRQKRNRTDWREGRKQGVTDSVLADPAAQIGAQIIGQTLDCASGEIRFGVRGAIARPEHEQGVGEARTPDPM
jgi:hypothetical protein